MPRSKTKTPDAPVQEEAKETQEAATQEAATQEAAIKYCPRCFRTEADLGECPVSDFRGQECPPPADFDPDTDVLFKSIDLGYTRAVPLKDLVSGRASRELPKVHRDNPTFKVI